MSGTTAILKLTLPPFDSVPWDQALNNDLIVIDAAVGKFFGVANLVGVWLNATAYVIGQVTVDSTDGSMWSCAVAHTSAVAPTTFSSDRATNPTFWIQAASTAQDYAAQAQIWASSATTSATAAATSATNAANSAAIVAGALPLSGGTLTGPLILAADPTNVRGAATKQYVDARVGGVGFLPTTGGTLTGFLTLNANPTTNLHAATKQYADGKLALTGGALTGALTTNNSINAAGYIAAQGGLFVDVGLTFGNYTESGLRIQQFNTGYYWEWNGANGDLFWVIAGGALWYMRTSDRLCFNNLAAVGGVGAYVNMSDERTKHDIMPLDGGLSILHTIEPISFKRGGSDREEFGFSAQNISRAVPQAVSVFKDDLLAVSSDMILAVAVNAIKQLDEKVNRLCR
jgi:hypothetical protein